MIIIKIIILYFIQIRHTDDFHSKGACLVNNNILSIMPMHHRASSCLNWFAIYSAFNREHCCFHRQPCKTVYGWMDGWMDGWMEGWMDGWMENHRWMDE